MTIVLKLEKTLSYICDYIITNLLNYHSCLIIETYIYAQLCTGRDLERKLAHVQAQKIFFVCIKESPGTKNCLKMV